MAEPLDIAPEFAKQPRITIPKSRLLLALFNFVLRLQRRRFRWGPEVEVRIHAVPVPEGPHVAVTEIAPKGLEGDAPAIVDYHGGGFFLSFMPLHLRYAERYALDARCRVFFPDYRLSGRHPFPAGFDDCFATLAWVHANAGELRVDPGRVLVLGDSAGGALAAGVAQKAHDRGDLPLCGQVLIYPVTDHETKTGSALRFTHTPLWKTASNRNMWQVYLAGHEGPAPPYAAPLHRASFAGLPPARVEVAEFDPLLDEGRLYAQSLRGAGVPVDLREVKGAIHGYDLVEGSPIAESVLGERLSAIRGLFGASDSR